MQQNSDADYKVTAGGSLGTPKVLTLGSPNLDFTLANGTTCIGGVTTGETCAANVTFRPRYAGGVSGAVKIIGDGGKVLSTTPIRGTGTGPQIGTLTNAITYIGVEGGPGSPLLPDGDIVIDGAGDAFGVNVSEAGNYTLVEQPGNGGPEITFPFTYNDDYLDNSKAIDGAGNIFVTGLTTVGMIPPGGGTAISLPFQPLIYPYAVAVDGIGDVFVLDNGSTRVSKLPGGCHSSACAVIVYENADAHIGSIVADPAGDLFMSDGTTITEYPAGGGSPLTFPTTFEPTALDGTRDFLAVALNPFLVFHPPYSYFGLEEMPAGSKTPVWLIPNIDNDYNCDFFPVALNPAGDSFITYYCNYDGGEEPYVAEYLRSQFAPLNFGSLHIGSMKILPLDITNTGNRTLVLKPYFLSRSYKILSATPSGCEAATAPGNTCTLKIQFTALSEGPHTITLTLGSNGAADANILLQGIGTK